MSKYDEEYKYYCIFINGQIYFWDNFKGYKKAREVVKEYTHSLYDSFGIRYDGSQVLFHATVSCGFGISEKSTFFNNNHKKDIYWHNVEVPTDKLNLDIYIENNQLNIGIKPLSFELKPLKVEKYLCKQYFKNYIAYAEK